MHHQHIFNLYLGLVHIYSAVFMNNLRCSSENSCGILYSASLWDKYLASLDQNVRSSMLFMYRLSVFVRIIMEICSPTTHRTQVQESSGPKTQPLNSLFTFRARLLWDVNWRSLEVSTKVKSLK